jgi:hypothetical protein
MPTIDSTNTLDTSLRRTPRVLVGALLFAAQVVACATPEGDSTDEAITEVHATSVKRQVIGNCWLYAITGWAEALHQSASGEELNLSESYLTYWYWFEQLTKAGACGVSKIEEGGSWELGRDLVRRYGMMREDDFIRGEGPTESSKHQASALAALQAALADKSSPMQRAVAAQDRKAIRAELDRMWGLAATTKLELDAAFGEDGARTLEKGSSALPAGSKVIAAARISAKVPHLKAPPTAGGTLADALGGPDAWTSATPPGWSGDQSASSRRGFERRIQRALHDGLPVPVAWWVDPESLDARGTFEHRGGEPSAKGGGHLSIITDYEVTSVPGFGTLKAGVAETRPEALRAALDPRAKVMFFRIKNSWGYWPSTWKETAMRLLGGVDLGYNDLRTSYLFDPMAVLVDSGLLSSAEPASGPCPSAQSPATGEMARAGVLPLLSVVLPPGY